MNKKEENTGLTFIIPQITLSQAICQIHEQIENHVLIVSIGPASHRNRELSVDIHASAMKMHEQQSIVSIVLNEEKDIAVISEKTKMIPTTNGLDNLFYYKGVPCLFKIKGHQE